MNSARIVTSVCAKRLTDDELLAINLAAQLGTDPRGSLGWDKAKPLFTIMRDGIPVAHDDIKLALNSITQTRFSE